MRIDRLDLTAFGPFTDATLDLSAGAEGLHLVYGPNEAGKSSALRAVQQFFEKIPTISTDNFIHDYKAMRIGASLRARAGTVVELVRRKGSKNTLLGLDGAPAGDAEGRLAALLGGVPIDEFLRKFVIDHDELVNGGRNVVASRGGLGQALFAAGSGIAGLGAVRKALDEEAERLYKPRASNPIINALFSEEKKLKDRKRDASLSSTVWRDQVDALARARARKDELGDKLRAADHRRDRLQRLSKALVPAARRAALLDELASLAAVPRLRLNFSFERRDVQSLLAPSEFSEAELQKSISALQESLRGLQVPDRLLAEAEAVGALYLRYGQQRQAALDRGRRETERARLEAEARAALRAIGRDPSLLDAGLDSPALESLRPRTADRAEIQELTASRQALDLAVEQASKEIKKDATQRSKAAEKLAGLGPARDSSALRKVTARATADLDDRRSAARSALAKQDRRNAAGLDALGLWSGALDALESLPVPLPETLERFRAELDAANADVSSCRQKLDVLDAEARQTVARLEGLRHGGHIPTEDALTDARKHRDDLWRRLAEAKAWDDAIAADHEPAVRRADDLADRLRREAERVATLAGLLADRALQGSERIVLAANLERASSMSNGLSVRWKALWEPLDVAEPGTPAEMLAWLRRQSKLVEDVRLRCDARDSLATLDNQAAEHRRALGEALEALGEPPPADREALAALIGRANEAEEAQRKQTKEREKLTEQIEALDRDRTGLDSARDAARADRDRWQSRWAAATARIHLNPDTTTTIADALLTETVHLFERVDQARNLRRDLDHADREASSFADDVRALASRVAPDLSRESAEPGAVAAELNARLGKAREAWQRRDEWTKQLRAKEGEALAAREAIAENRRKLDALCLEAGGDSPDNLPAIEARAAHRDKLESELAGLDDGLRELAAGAPLDAFLTQAADADLDVLKTRLDQLQETIKEQTDERDRVGEEAGGLKKVLEGMDGNANAADAGQDAEDLRAKIKEEVEQYARLRLASAVLKIGIERYRQKAEGPVLARASDLFARLTRGSFEALKVDYDEDDEPVLKGVRPGGRELLGVSALSFGTADQLYLALRLASLEAELDRREPLPLVVDDILIQFDDARASATLAALAALSKRTQVLVFTHHRHLLDLARDVVPDGDLFTHTLRATGSIK